MPKSTGRFASDSRAACSWPSEGKLDHWLAEPRGRLALIILTDQFPRNIYRDSPQAFALDAKALEWSLAGIEQGHDRSLRPIERVFFCLPLEHSERLEHQERSVPVWRVVVARRARATSQFRPVSRFCRSASRHRRALRPVSAPQPDSRPAIDAGGVGVSFPAGLVVLSYASCCSSRTTFANSVTTV